MNYTRESTHTRDKEQPDKNMMLHILAIAGATPDGAIVRVNNYQYYKDVPIIEIGFAGGAIQCWEPDEDVKHWAFTYSTAELNQDWSAFIPTEVREGIMRIAEQFDCEVYSYNGEE